MNALLAIAIELFPLILHLKPPPAEWENSCQQPRPDYLTLPRLSPKAPCLD
jgi:hypothetical protein